LSKKHRFSIYSFFIWGLAILFFLYEFFLRVFPATISKDIVSGLDISLEQFALISSAYYITYSIMQIPVGILLDRFPFKTVVTMGAALCTLGAVWFAFSHSFLPAFAARLLIGSGSAFGFITLIVVTLNWFPKKNFAFILGCGQLIGASGPLIAGGPVALLLGLVGDWRIIAFWVAIFGVGLTVLVGMFLEGKPVKDEEIPVIDKKIPLLKRISGLLRITQIWWVLVYAGTIYVALPILGAFWGTAYLEASGFEKPKAAFVISMIWLGLAIGAPLSGRLTDQMRKRKPTICLLAIIGGVSSSLILFGSITNEYYLAALFFLIGVAGTGQNISFALIAENAPKALRATAPAMNNTAIMGAGALLPLVVTLVMRYFSGGNVFSQAAFEKGLTLIPIGFSVALLVGLFAIKETFCRHRSEIHHLRQTHFGD